MMTTSQETIADTTYRGHEATIHALQNWADGVQKFCGWLPTRDVKAPSAGEVVDRYFDCYFDFVEHVVATQREFVKDLLATTKSPHHMHGSDKDYSDKDYSDKDYSDKDYSDKDYSDKDYTDKNADQ
jgi:hypothetical protein